MTLAYMMDWPEFEKYQDIEGFDENFWKVYSADGPIYVVDKEWFDSHCDAGEDHSYTGD